MIQNYTQARHWWLTPVILAIQEAVIRRIVVPSQPRQINSSWDSILKKSHHKKKDWWSGSRYRPWVKTPVLEKKKKKKERKKITLRKLLTQFAHRRFWEVLTFKDWLGNGSPPSEGMPNRQDSMCSVVICTYFLIEF
jgi:hypothetical protein